MRGVMPSKRGIPYSPSYPGFQLTVLTLAMVFAIKGSTCFASSAWLAESAVSSFPNAAMSFKYCSHTFLLVMGELITCEIISESGMILRYGRALLGFSPSGLLASVSTRLATPTVTFLWHEGQISLSALLSEGVREVAQFRWPS